MASFGRKTIKSLTKEVLSHVSVFQQNIVCYVCASVNGIVFRVPLDLKPDHGCTLHNIPWFFVPCMGTHPLAAVSTAAFFIN